MIGTHIDTKLNFVFLSLDLEENGGKHIIRMWIFEIVYIGHLPHAI